MEAVNEINKFQESHNLESLKLNLGCGGRRLSGWINVDLYDYENGDTSRSGSLYDVKMDITNLDVADNSCDEILLVHVIEHFTRWNTIKMLQHYHQKLRPGGLLIVEMPDLDKAIELYLKGKDAPHMRTPVGALNMGFTQFYGNQWDELEYETHRYVWTIAEFCHVCTNTGFEIRHATHDAKFHMKGRDMFVVGQKRIHDGTTALNSHH